MPAALAAARLDWHVPARREQARAWARVVGAGVTGGEEAAVDRLARAYLAERRARQELYWRPDVLRRAAVDGIEHVERGLAAGRGVIVTHPHAGPLTAAMHALAVRFGRVYIVRRATHHAAAVRGREGLWMRTQRVFLEASGVRLVTRGGAFDRFAALLSRNVVLFLAWDNPGEARVRFLGRAIPVRRGLDALAAATGAAVVPALNLRAGHRARVRLWPAIDASDGAPVAERVAAVTEPAVRERLAELDDTIALWWAR